MTSPEAGSVPTSRGRDSSDRASSRVTVAMSMVLNSEAVRGLAAAFFVFFAPSSVPSAASGRTSVT